MPPSGRERKCSKEKDTDSLSNESKRIYIPIEREEYEQILWDKTAFRQYLDMKVEQYPELFPSTIQQGYELHDILPPSKKMPDVRMRRIKVEAKRDSKEEVFTIAPSFVMPYMTGYTDDVENALFLRKFAVPYWALTRVFGRNDMYWERMELRFGRNSSDRIGSTTNGVWHLRQKPYGRDAHLALRL